MKVRSNARRRRWLQVGIAIAVLITSHALAGASANAASPPTVRSTGDAGTSTGPAIVFGGFTSQGPLPSFFRVSSNGKMLTAGGITLNMSCTSGTHFLLSDFFVRVRIAPNGRLHAAASQAPTAVGNGVTFGWADSLHAKLNRQRTQLSGVWQFTGNYTYTNGMSDQCSSGPVRFSDAS